MQYFVTIKPANKVGMRGEDFVILYEGDWLASRIKTS